MRRFNAECNLGVAVAEISNPSRVCGIIGYNQSDDRMELGYIMHPDIWGKGYATEALQASLKAWWEGYDGVRLSGRMKDELYATTHTGNDRSYRVLQKCGFEMIKAFEDEYGKGEDWKLTRPATMDST